jgi:hypothetical protein
MISALAERRYGKPYQYRRLRLLDNPSQGV